MTIFANVLPLSNPQPTVKDCITSEAESCVSKTSGLFLKNTKSGGILVHSDDNLMATFNCHRILK